MQYATVRYLNEQARPNKHYYPVNGEQVKVVYVSPLKTRCRVEFERNGKTVARAFSYRDLHNIREDEV